MINELDQERIRLEERGLTPEEIKIREKRKEFYDGMNNLYEKFRSIDYYYHVPKYAR